jgi:Cu/Ag efflux protein CusF
MAGGQSTSITATVEEINTEARELTLKGPKGNFMIMEVPKSVKRFPEIKVGDRLTFRYSEALLLALHKADAGATLGMSGQLGGESYPGKKPGGMYSRQVTATVAVEAVDAAAPSITVKTSDGKTRSFRVQDKKDLEGVNPGDKLTITYHEALAIQVSAPPSK